MALAAPFVEMTGPVGWAAVSSDDCGGRVGSAPAAVSRALPPASSDAGDPSWPGGGKEDVGCCKMSSEVASGAVGLLVSVWLVSDDDSGDDDDDDDEEDEGEDVDDGSACATKSACDGLAGESTEVLVLGTEEKSGWELDPGAGSGARAKGWKAAVCSWDKGLVVVEMLGEVDATGVLEMLKGINVLDVTGKASVREELVVVLVELSPREVVVGATPAADSTAVFCTID